MWSVLDFVSPGSFGTHAQWDETIGRPLKAGLDYNASVKQLAEKQASRWTEDGRAGETRADCRIWDIGGDGIGQGSDSANCLYPPYKG
jgi:hypothetical protein